MATNKRVFTLRLQDDVFEKIECIAKHDHRSLTNAIEYILLQYIKNYEDEHVEIQTNKE